MDRHRKEQIEQTERLAKENEVRTSNGNQRQPQPSKPGGAERGGPGIETAHDRQPPDSTLPIEGDQKEKSQSLENKEDLQ